MKTVTYSRIIEILSAEIIPALSPQKPRRRQRGLLRSVLEKRGAQPYSSPSTFWRHFWVKPLAMR
jgi:hypothetical protein